MPRPVKRVGGDTLALRGGAARVTLDTGTDAHLLVLSGAEIAEPVVMEGPFIMNDTSQVRSAVDRYRSGEWGT